MNVRYMRDFRRTSPRIDRVLVPAAGGQRQIPLSQLATVQAVDADRP